MTEDNNIKANIKEALRKEEQKFPQMPADLNAHLMARVEKEVNTKPKRSIAFWPWIVAACVAALITVYLMPPRVGNTEEPDVAKVAPDTTKKQKEVGKEDNPQPFVASNKSKTQIKSKVQRVVDTPDDKLIAKAEAPVETKPAEVVVDENPADIAEAEKPAIGTKRRVLSERDLPVTRPENLKYTKEEIALMRKQANEAYLKWAELELEIAKYNQEQTAAN